MANSKRKKAQRDRMDIDEVFGVIGKSLRREHIGELVWDLGILIEEAKLGREDRILVALESIAETLSNASDKFERSLFIPAIEVQRKRTIDANAKHKEQMLKNERRWQTESLEEYVRRGGKVTIATPKGKLASLTLEDLDL